MTHGGKTVLLMFTNKLLPGCSGDPVSSGVKCSTDLIGEVHSHPAPQSIGPYAFCAYSHCMWGRLPTGFHFTGMSYPTLMNPSLRHVCSVHLLTLRRKKKKKSAVPQVRQQSVTSPVGKHYPIRFYLWKRIAYTIPKTEPYRLWQTRTSSVGFQSSF